jgi:FkbM family methyltransferase
MKNTFMIDRFRHKLSRLLSLRELVGLGRSLGFEVRWSLRRPEVDITLPGYPAKFTIRRFSSDIHVFGSVFLHGELEETLPKDPRFIVDGGANVGYTTAFYAHRYPDATVIAIEPSRSNLAQLRRNCSGYRNVVALEGALWPTSGSVRIANPEAESWSYRVETADDPGGVRAFSLDELLDAYSMPQIDMLKLDIEGAERLLFGSNYGRWLPRVKAIAVEIHGEEAYSAIERACTPEMFEWSTNGEKVFLMRRT